MLFIPAGTVKCVATVEFVLFLVGGVVAGGAGTLGHCCLDVGECWIMNDVWPPTTPPEKLFFIFYFLFCQY
jgi:hypothetical protein